MATNKANFQPIDRVAVLLMLLLSLFIVLLILQGDAVRPTVREFNWQNQKIGSEDTSFVLTFSRPMNTKSVEENIKIDPPLAGKISWSARRMAYTLLTPAPYGTKYKVELQGGRDQFSNVEGNKRVMRPFVGSFTTRDRAILYIATNEKNRGQLVLYNLTNEQNYLLTPKDLVVLDYKPYPNQEKVLFSARPKENQDPLSAQLYTVTTGISSEAGKEAESAGKLDLILDNKNYENIKFELSSDGQTVVIQRGNKSKPGEYGLWFMPANKDATGDKLVPQPLKSQPGGDFLITPDSKAVAVAQGQGTAILALSPNATKPQDYLPQYGLVQAFSKDGTQAAMVRFNTDYTKELFLVTNQGVQKSLLTTTGSIYKCQFDLASPTLYCLVTQLLPGTIYQEQPFIVAIDTKTGQQKTLLPLAPGQRNIKMNISPDGLGLLIDQIVPQTDSTSSPANTLTADDGEPIANSSLWLMPLLPITDPASANLKPEQLPLFGYNPRWLP